MDIKERPLAWFSIPVSDIARAMAFYSQVLGLEMEIADYQGQGMAHFPASEGHAGGALIEDPDRAGKSGVLIYFNAGQELSPYLQRV
jgi:predicted enzyme related to lactoylglutathione lyase